MADYAARAVEGVTPGAGVQRYVSTGELEVLSSPAHDVSGVVAAGSVLVNGTYSLTGPSSSDRLGAQLIAADVGGDGRSDVIVSAYAPMGEASFWILEPQDPSRFASSIDVGLPDVGLDFDVAESEGPVIVAGAPSASSGAGALWIYEVESSSAMLASIGTGGLGAQVEVGDLDGDGIDDVVAGAPYHSGPGALVIWNGIDSLGPDPVQVVMGDTTMSDLGGQGLSIGDVNGDGSLEVVAGSMSVDGDSVVVFQIDSGFEDVHVLSRVEGPDGAWFGRSVGLPGDLDDDGHVEIAIGAHGTSLYGGVHVVSGPFLGVVDPGASLYGRTPGGLFGRYIGVADGAIAVSEEIGSGEAGTRTGVVWLLTSTEWQ